MSLPYRHGRIDGSDIPLPVGKAVCVGRNYAAHIQELGNAQPEEPVLFMKPATAFRPMASPIQLPGGECHHELELVLLIGEPLHQADEFAARAAVVGYGLALDLTLRDVQARLKEKGLPWERAKAFDGSCPITPFVPAAQVSDPHALRFTLEVNGVARQQGDPKLMLWSMFQLLGQISQCFTLLPGDMVLTGTPAGVAALRSGDQLRLILEGQTPFTTRVA